jgi:uncharacterized protein
MLSVTAEELLAFHRCQRLPYLQRFGPKGEKLETDGLVLDLRAEREALIHKVQTTFSGRTAHQDPGLTSALIETKTERIYQACLESVIEGVRVESFPDLLLWQAFDPQKPFQTDFYLPVDIRTAKRLKSDYELGLAIHALLLGARQKVIPTKGMVVLRDGSWESVSLNKGIHQVYRLLEAWRSLVHDSADIPQVYMARSRCGLCVWRNFCRARQDPLLLLPGVTGQRHQILQTLQITSIEALATATVDSLSVPGLGRQVGQELIRQAQATLHQKPLWIEEPDLISHPTELYFDIEADPNRDIIFLFGILVVDAIQQTSKYYSLLAENAEEEADTWQKFLQLMMEYPDSPIYHFHKFEVDTCEKLGQQYGTQRRVLKSLLNRFIDLHHLVTTTVVLPIESYSLKNIARWMGFQWQNKEASGAQSIYWYSQWIQSQDRSYLEAILQYNEDDCRATFHLKEWMIMNFTF